MTKSIRLSFASSRYISKTDIYHDLNDSIYRIEPHILLMNMRTPTEIEDLLMKKAQLWGNLESLNEEERQLVTKMIELEKRVNTQTIEMIAGFPPSK